MLTRPLDTSRHALLEARARQMRLNPTTSEAVLFAALRGRRLGVAFRRQVVVGKRIVDLLAPSLGLVVEVDGGYHRRTQRADARRDRELALAGYRVLRIPAEIVLTDLQQAVVLVAREIQRLGR